MTPLHYDAAGGRHEVVHWISRDPINAGNVTACGKPHVFPMRGNGWRVRDVTCSDCLKALDITNAS